MDLCNFQAHRENGIGNIVLKRLNITQKKNNNTIGEFIDYDIWCI